jgi:hypothetical protein
VLVKNQISGIDNCFKSQNMFDIRAFYELFDMI